MKPLKPIHTDSHHSIKLVYKDAEGVPHDLTGASAELVIRKTLYDAVLIRVSAVIDEPNGLITFTINPEDTQGILGENIEGVFLIGAVLTAADNTKTTLFQRTVDIKKNIVGQ